MSSHWPIEKSLLAAIFPIRMALPFDHPQTSREHNMNTLSHPSEVNTPFYIANLVRGVHRRTSRRISTVVFGISRCRLLESENNEDTLAQLTFNLRDVSVCFDQIIPHARYRLLPVNSRTPSSPIKFNRARGYLADFAIKCAYDRPRQKKFDGTRRLLVDRLSRLSRLKLLFSQSSGRYLHPTPAAAPSRPKCNQPCRPIACTSALTEFPVARRQTPA